MATANNGEDLQEISKTLKEGERLLAPTRRPDGSLRKPIRIRAGYVPQDEVAIYQSKGALWKKEMAAAQVVPPGYDPVSELKPKSKSVKRNERKKEKRLQAAIDKGKNSDPDVEGDIESENVLSIANVESVASHMIELTISANHSTVKPPTSIPDSLDPGCAGPDIDKKIRALKKKIRLTEAQQQKTEPEDMKPEQLDKIRKLEDWHRELKLLEDKKAQSESS